MDQVTNWLRQQISNPQVVFLTIFAVGTLLVILYAGSMLAPVLASVVIAYLLEGIIKRLRQWHIPRLLAVFFVVTAFVLFILISLLVLLPRISEQIGDVVRNIPSIISKGQSVLLALPERYPDVISISQVNRIIESLTSEVTIMGQHLVSSSISGAANIITMLIYVILMPILVFFFLKDKHQILGWFRSMTPQNSQLASSIWSQVDVQIGNYIRGKFWEILIIWGVSFVAFNYLGLQYAMLLSLMVGLSVIIPFVGAAIVTIPVLLIAFFQWGWSSEFITLAVTYIVIQALDGNLLVPLLFSEVVNLHPVSIIVSILFFGGIWGLWGVFFAIPLASLIQAIFDAWPKLEEIIEEG